MPQTSWMAQITKRRGYTLIEMMVVTLILALLSAIIVPNYVNMRDGQKRREFYTEVVDMAGTARELAISHHATMYVQADTSANSLVIRQESNDTTFTAADGNSTPCDTSTNASGERVNNNPQSNIGTATNDRSSDTTAAKLPMPPSMAFGNFQLAGQSSDSSSWKVRYFPDGSCDGGAVELDDRGSLKSLVINKKGGASLIEGSIPDVSQSSWVAGSNVLRQ